MIGDALVQGGLYLVVLLLLARPLGNYMYRVYMGRVTLMHPILGSLERLVYRLGGINPRAEMGWREYATALLVCNALGFLVLYAVLRLQGVLPLNPAGHRRATA
jgi:K+-transporting ATPase ATPase A chain